MSIAHARYVQCDVCGTPAPVVVGDAREARSAAVGEGFARVRNPDTGRLEDRCREHHDVPCRACGQPLREHYYGEYGKMCPT